MKKYIYKGVNSAITLQHDGKPLDILLFDGKTVEMPSGNEATNTLILNGNLTLVAEAIAVVPSELVTEALAPVAPTKLLKGAK